MLVVKILLTELGYSLGFVIDEIENGVMYILNTDVSLNTWFWVITEILSTSRYRYNVQERDKIANWLMSSNLQKYLIYVYGIEIIEIV